MPCAAVDPPEDWWDGEEDALAPLSAFVGNAVEAGQPCSWHTDFDPFHALVDSPWEARFGRYGNRQARAPLNRWLPCAQIHTPSNLLIMVLLCSLCVLYFKQISVTMSGQICVVQRGKPLCVSMLVYLNEAWPPEFDAETLFLDPGSGTGVLVRKVCSVPSCPELTRMACCQSGLPGAQPIAAHSMFAWAPCVLPNPRVSMRCQHLLVSVEVLALEWRQLGCPGLLHDSGDPVTGAPSAWAGGADGRGCHAPHLAAIIACPAAPVRCFWHTFPI